MKIELTDGELDQLVEQEWLKHGCSGWGLTHRQLIEASYSTDDMHEGATVYVSENGHEMSRIMCSDFIRAWSSFQHGFKVAYKALKTN